MWEEELDCCKKIAVKAGMAIIKVYNSKAYCVNYKEDNSPVTLADKTANEIIVKALKENFPYYALLSEEEKDFRERLLNDCCFIVDPLDGTKEFIKRNGQFTVNIALSYKNKSVLGVIYVPVTQRLYYASKGVGAYLEKNGNVERLHVSERLDNLRYVTSLSHKCKKWEDFVLRHDIDKDSILNIGSSLKGCLVADGVADVYYRFNQTKEWDTAAMQCIVEEAGGILKQMDGSEMLYNRENVINEKGFYVVNRKENEYIE